MIPSAFPSARKHSKLSNAIWRRFVESLAATPPTSPILFYPDADEPMRLSEEKYERMMIDAMAEVGISPAMIFALKRTGRIVTERNRYLLSAEQLREWDDAVAEYHGRIESGEAD